MRKVYLLLIAVAALFVSCKTVYTESQSRNIQPTFATNVIPLAANLNVSQRISEEVVVSSSSLDEAFTAEVAKEKAVAIILKKYNADVLVAPIFEVYKESTSNSYRVTVIGYPASFTNFRPATVVDCEAYKRFRP